MVKNISPKLQGIFETPTLPRNRACENYFFIKEMVKWHIKQAYFKGKHSNCQMQNMLDFTCHWGKK